MFAQNNEEKKLDWMYKGPGSAVDREEYLLGRSVDKSLEILNAAEKQGSSVNPTKNHVEHECIPPSIRDYKKQQLGEQVDLAQKLQEDPLVAIKKQEEETRQKLLQNPVQLKKLQKVLKLKSKKKKKKSKKKHKKHSGSDSDGFDKNLDKKFTKKYEKMKKHLTNSEDDELDKILIKKFMQFKHLLTKTDLDEILNLKDESCSEEEKGKKSKKRYESSSDSDNPRKKFKQTNKKYDSSDNEYNNQKNSRPKQLNKRRSRSPGNKQRDMRKYNNRIREDSNKRRFNGRYSYVNKRQERNRRVSGPSRRKFISNSDESDYHKNDSDDDKSKLKRNFGLINADGTKIPQNRKHYEYDKKETKIKIEEHKPTEKTYRKRLTDKEKEQRRREMMKDAKTRDYERERNVRRHREADLREVKEQNYNPEFIQRELLKSANNSTVESRIKSNINNIQRSGRDMSNHFSRRH